MRRDLGRHVHLRSPAQPHHIQTLAGTDVRHMQASALLAGQAHVALHHLPFAGSRLPAQAQLEAGNALVHRMRAADLGVLCVLNDREADLGRQRKGLAHDVVVEDRFAVVAEGDGASLAQSLVVAEFFSLAAQRGRSNRKDVDHRAALAVLHPARDGRRIIHRARVGHGAHRGESAHGRSRRTGGNRFFVRLARLAQVHVQINKPGSDDEPLQVELFVRRGLRLAGRCDFNHQAIFQHQIGWGIHARSGINQMTAIQ